MPASVPKSKRVQVRLSEELGGQVALLSEYLGMSESSAAAMLIDLGLARYKEMRGDLPAPSRPAASEVHRKVRDAKEADASESRHEPPGFRPGGRPRALLIDEEPVYTHGEWYTGYMKGL